MRDPRLQASRPTASLCEGLSQLAPRQPAESLCAVTNLLIGTQKCESREGCGTGNSSVGHPKASWGLRAATSLKGHPLAAELFQLTLVSLCCPTNPFLEEGQPRIQLAVGDDRRSLHLVGFITLRHALRSGLCPPLGAGACRPALRQLWSSCSSGPGEAASFCFLLHACNSSASNLALLLFGTLWEPGFIYHHTPALQESLGGLECSSA